MKAGIIVGSRGSKLALVQTESVASRLRDLNPGLNTSITKIITAGDRDRHTGLDRIGVDVFVKELEEALLDRRIDLAVHSLKDVPTEIPDGLCLLAVTERLDPRDALVSKSRLDELAPGSRVGTGSLRRSIQLKQYRPDLEPYGIRGNVDTRLCKTAQGSVDAVIVAAAAMSRLGWEDRIVDYLPLEHFLPSAGQGALVVEARLDDKESTELVRPINHLTTWQSVAAERAFLRTLGGGCRAPIAALATVTDGTLKLEGMVASVSGQQVLRFSAEGPANTPEEVGENLAYRMLEMGASQFIAEVRAR